MPFASLKRYAASRSLALGKAVSELVRRATYRSASHALGQRSTSIGSCHRNLPA